MQKESNRTKQRKSNGERKQLRSTNLDLGQFLQWQSLFKLVKRIQGFETKLQALESPDSDKRAESYTKTKIRAKITIENNHEKTLEKEKLTNRLTNERSLSAAKR